MEYILESATNQQLEQICEIWEAGWHEAHAAIVPPELLLLRTKESFRTRALENLGCTRVALDQSGVLGFCMVKEDELYQMYVSRRARGSGVAQALIRDAEDRIRANGHKTAWLACGVGNERARHFYSKSGWVNAGKKIVDMDTSAGSFPLEVWRFEKELH